MLLFCLACMLQIFSCQITALGTQNLSYEDARKAYLQAEDLLTTGGQIQLNRDELKVDDLYMQHKLTELAQGYRNAELNAAAMHFFKAKKLIERSKIFKFLQKMPKGALLHVHNTASVSSKWVVHNISYMPGLLRCTNKDNVSILSFRKLPKQHGCRTQYVRVSDERTNSIDSQTYDENFEKLINLFSNIPELEYPSITSVWNKFENMFLTLSDALLYLPAFRAYHWQMLQEMYNDNIMYGEVRIGLKMLYDIKGRTFPSNYTVQELVNIVNKFKRLHVDFLGIKIICAVHRTADASSVREQFKSFRKLHSSYPNFIAGFDLVGQEDKGKPLYNFIQAINELPPSAHYFFHAGETNWFGASTDFNLLDALLLNTTRIGHGYALAKHPVLMNAVKKRHIAIEVSPISNQVLHLVWDMRNHPGAIYLAQNIPMVICNDDPGFWAAKGLSYDYYYTIMSMAPNNAGLRMLKSLVWNSIRYSVLTDTDRVYAYELLERAWNKFITQVLQGNVF